MTILRYLVACIAFALVLLPATAATRWYRELAWPPSVKLLLIEAAVIAAIVVWHVRFERSLRRKPTESA